MRILHVHSGNLYGGVERMLTTFARTSPTGPIDHQFAVCFEGRVAAELRGQGAMVEQLGAVRMRDPLSIGRARRNLRDILKSRRFNTAICHMPWAQVLFGPVIRQARVPLIFWMHDLATGRHWLERAARRTAPDLALCNSYYTAETLDALYPHAPRKVIYPPIEIERETIARETRNAIRAALGTPKSAVVIMQASRMESWKGHAIHLQALGLLREIPGWVCWIAGGAQRAHEAGYCDKLKALAAQLGVTERIRFCGDRCDVPLLLRAADIYCQPNLRPEPFGIVFGEAMAAGLPFVTTGLGGVAELVDATCGLTVPASEPQALAAVLQELIINAERRIRLGTAGAARIAALCDPQRQARELAAAVESIVATETAARPADDPNACEFFVDAASGASDDGPMVLAAVESSACGRLRERMRAESRVRYLAWRASRLRRPLMVTLAHGEQLILRNPPAGDLSVAHEIFVQEIYRSPRRLARVSMIVDVGANNGFSLLYFAHSYAHARLIGFEPHPAHLELIRQHLRINKLAERVTVIPAAAGVNQRTAFLTDEGERSRIVEDSGSERIPVRVVNFFETIQGKHLDLLKLDCEGGEYDLIMDDRFAGLDVRTIVLEWHASAHHPSPGAELRARLAELRFTLAGESEKKPGAMPSGMLWAYRE